MVVFGIVCQLYGIRVIAHAPAPKIHLHILTYVNIIYVYVYGLYIYSTYIGTEFAHT